MYEDQFQRLRPVLLSVLVVIISLLVFYVATHGRVYLSNQGDEMVSIVKIRNDQTLEPLKDIKNGAILGSGLYMIQNNSDGSQRVAHIKVPRWLQRVSVTYQNSPTASVQRSAALTYENYFNTEQGELLSFTDLNDYISGYTTHSPTDAFGGKYKDIPLERDIYSPVVSSKGTVIGLTEGEISEYSPSSKQYTQLMQVETENETATGVTSDIKIQRSSNVESDVIGLYEGAKKQLTILGGIKKTQTYKDVDVGTLNIIYDITDKGWVSVRNTASAEKTIDVKDEEKKNLYKLSVYSRSSETPKVLDIGQVSSVGAVALAPDMKHVAVEKDSQLWVYETETGKVVMMNAFTNTNKLFWYNAKLYSLSTDLGISVFNPESKQLVSVGLGGNGTLSFSNITPVGTKLFFTAFEKNGSSKLPDGYILDLMGKKSNIAEDLAKKLPYSTNQYDINYLHTTIYIRINYYNRSGDTPETLAKIESIKSEAKEKLESLVSKETLANTSVVFSR